MQKVIVGIVVIGIIIWGGILVNNAVRNSKEKHREDLETILRTSDGPQFGDISRNTPFFDGGAASIIETSFTTSNVDQTRAILQQRLTEKGYKLTCPGGKDDSAPSNQERATEPRQKCGLNGHGAHGTIWLGTYGKGTEVSAIVTF